MDQRVAALGPQTEIDPHIEIRLGSIGRILRWWAGIYATLAFASVQFEPLETILPDGPDFLRPLPTSAALPLAVLALGAIMAADTRRATRGEKWRRVGSVLCGVVAVYGLYIVAVYAVSFPDLWPTILESAPLPSLWVGLIALLLGSAVLLSTSRVERNVIAGQISALVAFSATAVLFLGYIYDDVTVGRLLRPPEITFQATLVSLFISIGVSFIRPGSGLLAAAVSPGSGGRLLRRLGPVALLMPALLLLIIEVVPFTERRGAIAFISVGLGVVLLIGLALIVRLIDETKREALSAAAAAERARVGLEQEAPVVQVLSDSLHIVDLSEDSSLDVATRFRPGRGSVAGDASAIRTFPDGSVGAVLVDMTGHGADPAVRAIRVRDLLVHSMALGRSPAEALGLVGWSAPGDVLASAVAVKMDPSSGAVDLASAGHPPAIYVGSQEAELIESTGPLLYLDADSEFGEVRFELAPGETLVLVSDGIADVQRMRGGRPEPNVLADALLSEGGVATRTAELVMGFADAEPSDDQSALVIRRKP